MQAFLLYYVLIVQLIRGLLIYANDSLYIRISKANIDFFLVIIIYDLTWLAWDLKIKP